MTDTYFAIDQHTFEFEIGDTLVLPVQSTFAPYAVRFLPAKDSDLVELARLTPSHRIWVLDRTVERLFSLASTLDIESPILLDASEDSKTIETVTHLVDAFAARGVTKTSQIVAIGGGVVQELVAFACAIFKRGIPWVFVPTTLVAQVDSCVGGKCGLNHADTKNLLGLFSPPSEVFIQPSFLQTLSDDALRSGLGEAMRVHITGGPACWTHFATDVEMGFGRNSDALLRLVQRSLAIKKAVVEYDEFESNHRRALNYGHTFGHAIEAQSSYRIAHGTAVVVGCLIENELACEREELSALTAQEIFCVAQPLVTRETRSLLAQLDVDATVKTIAQDKKAQGSSIYFALMRALGDTVFTRMDLANPQDQSSLRTAFARVREQLVHA